MGKFIVTNYRYENKNIIFYGLHDGKRFYNIGFEDKRESVKIGNVYVGLVKDIVGNINAAFVEFSNGVTGYYSLDDNKHTIFLNKKNTDKVCQGDLILVQVMKEAIKTKFCVLTSKISLGGVYAVLNYGKSGIGFSNKIQSSEIRNEFKRALKDCFLGDESGTDYGVVIRTNAVHVQVQTVLDEVISLKEKMDKILESAKYLTKFSLVYREPADYLKQIRGFYDGEITEIVTDSEDLYQEICAFETENMLSDYQATLYRDDLLPLYKLYNVEGTIADILNKKVWLKSGAYLIIEQTDAMVVIDVNTGKGIKGKNMQSHLLQVNIEAAKEIAYQLQVRNLSGIIMIDFINMTEQKNKDILISEIKKEILKDKIKTDFVEMTKLDLVELTRKKTESSIVEQLDRIVKNSI